MATDIETRLDREWEALGAAGLPELQDLAKSAAPEAASRRAVLVELEDTRLSFNELRMRIESTEDADRQATSRWTVRDVIAHLASWAARTRLELESFVEGKTSPETIHFEGEGGPRAWNQREVDARAGRTTAALFEEIDAEITRIAAIVARTRSDRLLGVVDLPRTAGDPPTAWRMSISAMIVGSCWHSRYHLARLERL